MRLNVKTASDKFIALFDTQLSSKDHSSWLGQELINYLDDHHHRVDMFRYMQLPARIKTSPLLSNLYYSLQLLFSPRSMIILDGKLLAKLSPMIKLIKKLRNHLIVLTGSSLKQDIYLQSKKTNSGIFNLALKAIDFFFIDTEMVHHWLVEQHVDQTRIMIMKDEFSYRPTTSGGEYIPVKSKAVKRLHQRQFGHFFQQMICS